MNENFKKWVGLFCIIGAMVMSFVSLCMPPEGEVHWSVLTLIAEVLFFVGALFNIEISRLSAIKDIQDTIKDVKSKS